MNLSLNKAKQCGCIEVTGLRWPGSVLFLQLKGPLDDKHHAKCIIIEENSMLEAMTVRSHICKTETSAVQNCLASASHQRPLPDRYQSQKPFCLKAYLDLFLNINHIHVE